MNNEQNNGGYAFPVAGYINGHGNEIPGEYGMTLREYAAIKLRVPNSGVDWLDDMIRESQRDWFAGQALVAIAANESFDISGEIVAAWSYQQSDLMPAARDMTAAMQQGDEG